MAKKRSTKKVTTNQKEEFFVAIKDPSIIRVSLLESTKKVLESMKLFQEMKEIRKHKIEQKTLLRKQIKKISAMLGNIKSALPHVNLPTDIGSVEEKVPNVEKPRAAPVERVKPQSELDRIEKELMDIENKLSNI